MCVFGYDNNKWVSNRNNHYPNIDIPEGDITIEGYEVFQVIKQ